MSRTYKDLKSNRKGVGRYGDKPQRKLTPFLHDANKVIGKNEVLGPPPNNDISQDGQGYNAKEVRSYRRQVRLIRDVEKSTARTRIKRNDKKLFGNL